MNDTLTIKQHLTSHCTSSMENALAAERFPLWKRACDTLDDVTFLRHGLVRCISHAHSGRHYLQVTDEINNEPLLRISGSFQLL